MEDADCLVASRQIRIRPGKSVFAMVVVDCVLTEAAQLVGLAARRGSVSDPGGVNPSAETRKLVKSVPNFRVSILGFTPTAARNSENVFPSLGGIQEYVGLPQTKFQWCGFDVFLAARRRVNSGFKAVSRSSKFRESLPQRRI